MPLFMDYHDNLKLPAEAVQQIAQETRNRAADQFGVRQVELYHNADGKVYCCGRLSSTTTPTARSTASWRARTSRPSATTTRRSASPAATCTR